MARSNPRKRASRKAPRPGAVLSVALLPLLPIQGCFNSVEDREYTVKKGEMISAVDMEVEPDGSLLLLTQIGMYYSREGAPEEYERSNLHTVLHRRSNGAWSAMPFKNLQYYPDFFPSFLRDRDGGFRIMIRDADRGIAYGLRENRWTRQNVIRRPAGFGGNRWNPDRNWNRHPLYGYKGDSTLYETYWENDGTVKIREGRGEQKAHVLGFGFTPLAFHAGNGYSALLGLERDTAYREAVSRPVLRHWREDPEDMISIRLDSLVLPFLVSARTGNPETPGKSLPDPSLGELDAVSEWLIWPTETFFAPFREGIGLYYCRETRCGILALDSAGLPASVEFPETFPDSLKADAGSKVAPDRDGCLHGVGRKIRRDANGFIVQGDTTRSGAGTVVVWDACRGVQDTVVLWESPTGKSYNIQSLRFRLLPDGSPVVAALIQEYETYSRSPLPGAPMDRTWLILAQRKQGVWSTEIVDSR